MNHRTFHHRLRTPCVGAALMEVLLALALFAAAAGVVTIALNAALTSLERQRLSLHGLNLATSMLAEIQLGIRPLGADSRKPFPAPFQEWSGEVLIGSATDPDSPGSGEGWVEVVVRRENPQMVQRLMQVLSRTSGGATENGSGFGPGSL